MQEKAEFWTVQKIDQAGNVMYSKVFQSRELAKEAQLALIESNDENSTIIMSKSPAKMLTE